MEHEEEKYYRKQPVNLQEVAIGKPAQQREYHEDDERVEADLTNGSRRILQRAEKRRPFCTRRGTSRLARGRRHHAKGGEPSWSADPQPVRDRHEEAGDAEPLVQPVALVEPADEGLHLRRSYRQYHRHTYHAHGEDASVVDERQPHLREWSGVQQDRIGGDPQSRDADAQYPEADLDARHFPSPMWKSPHRETP